MNSDKNTVSPDDFSVVDLFCGVGGLTHGFLLEGLNVSAGVDFDKSCKYSFEENNNGIFYHKDISQLHPVELLSYFEPGKRKILVGCAPCQPFSIYNHKKSNSSEQEESNDQKWKLLYSFADLVEGINPEIISMENVPRLLKFDEGKIFNDFVSRLQARGYSVSYYLVDAKYYGVPQRRRRLILFGSKHGRIELVPPIIKKGEEKTVRDAIGHLPEVEDGVAHPIDALHIARKLNQLNKRRIQATSEGGFWRDWDRELWLECHKKDSGRAFRSVYGRMTWNDVAPTMTTYCTGLSNGRFGHPSQDRAITLREAALLQSFPEYYSFIDPNTVFSILTIARQIGNAVPVALGVAIAQSIKQHILSIGK